MTSAIVAAPLLLLAAQQPVYRAGDPGVEAPRLEKKIDPTYTAEAMNDGVEGTVHLAAVIDAKGRVRQIKITKSLDPGLDANAVKALEQWKFSPARKDGRAVDFAFELQVGFDRRGGRRDPVYAAGAAGVSNPEVVKELRPLFPLKLGRTDFKVVLEGVVEADGIVTSVRVTKPVDKQVDAIAIATFLGWRFKPATVDGRAVASRVTMEFSYHTRTVLEVRR